MRVVGVLLVSALMVVPVAAAQLVARSFRVDVRARRRASACVVAVAGVIVSFYADTPSGGTIVLLGDRRVRAHAGLGRAGRRLRR